MGSFIDDHSAVLTALLLAAIFLLGYAEAAIMKFRDMAIIRNGDKIT